MIACVYVANVTAFTPKQASVFSQRDVSAEGEFSRKLWQIKENNGIRDGVLQELLDLLRGMNPITELLLSRWAKACLNY